MSQSQTAFASPLEEANRLFSEALYREAAKAYQIVADDDPANAYAWRGLGVSLSHMGDLHGAIEACTRAVNLMPGNADLHYALGYTFVQAKRYPEAIAELDKVMILQPTHEEARKGLVFALIHEGAMAIDFDLALAQNLLERAHKFEPRNPHTLAPLLEVLYRTNQRGKVSQILVDTPDWLKAHEEVLPVYTRIRQNPSFNSVLQQFESAQQAAAVRPVMITPDVHHANEKAPCPNCQLQISYFETICPYCGAKVRKGP